MILVVHIGGSRMKWALAGPRGWIAQGVTANAEIGTLALREWHSLPRPGRAIGLNAAGEAARVRTEAQMTRWRVAMEWIVPTAAAGGVVNRYVDPAQLSPARWASLVASRRRSLAGTAAPGPCVVVNAGTLVSIDALDADGVFRGGVLLPGPRAMLGALGASGAPGRIGTGRFSPFPVTNADAAATGVIAAASGAIERVRGWLADGDGAVACYVTGGAATEIAPHLAGPWEVVDNLVLEGALVLAESP
ncbi:MAG: type III pantothenate kinase [Burkholderiales bacterium]